MTLSKKRLEIILEKLEPHPRPSALYEQYTIPGYLAAHMLHTAEHTFRDIASRVVTDLGAGTGRLAIGAKLLGAAESIGVDIDAAAIDIARKNSTRANAECEWVVGDKQAIKGKVDTVVMNPPFGTKIPHADIQFLKHATAISSATYSLHKTTTRAFIQRSLEAEGLDVEVLYQTRFEIPHMFDFHKKRKVGMDVDLIRVSGT